MLFSTSVFEAAVAHCSYHLMQCLCTSLGTIAGGSACQAAAPQQCQEIFLLRSISLFERWLCCMPCPPVCCLCLGNMVVALKNNKMRKFCPFVAPDIRIYADMTIWCSSGAIWHRKCCWAWTWCITAWPSALSPVQLLILLMTSGCSSTQGYFKAA